MGRLIDSKTWKVIEITLMRYPEQKKKLNEMLEDIVMTQGSSSGKTNFDTEYSKPQSVTESKALKLQNSFYQRIEKQVCAVEFSFNQLTESEKKVISTRYWSNSERKIPYINIDSGYSERQMKRIVFKTIYQIGVRLGEIEV